MFTLEQITEAHSVVKTGADFPKYIAALARLGVERYDVFVSDGHAEYFGADGVTLASAPKYGALAVAETSDAARFRERLAMHQAGETDYMTFCQDAAVAGVEKWRVDVGALTCTYFDRAGRVLLEEAIPKA
ncbi:MAG: DUF1398 domain-containing protein [Thermomicrobiales bacterium]|nr:MAG: DUF1398 domain-containing protein [Thermomicrobiales bacterium]